MPTLLHQISSQLEAVVQPGTPVVGFSELFEALGVIAGLVVSKLPLTTRFGQGLVVAHCTVTVKLQLAMTSARKCFLIILFVVYGKAAGGQVLPVLAAEASTVGFSVFMRDIVVENSSFGTAGALARFLLPRHCAGANQGRQPE
jgi:hypothetical protein